MGSRNPSKIAFDAEQVMMGMLAEKTLYVMLAGVQTIHKMQYFLVVMLKLECKKEFLSFCEDELFCGNLTKEKDE